MPVVFAFNEFVALASCVIVPTCWYPYTSVSLSGVGALALNGLFDGIRNVALPLMEDPLEKESAHPNPAWLKSLIMACIAARAFDCISTKFCCVMLILLCSRNSLYAAVDNIPTITITTNSSVRENPA